MAWNHELSRAVLRVYTRVLLDVYTRGARARRAGVDALAASPSCSAQAAG